MPDYAVEPGGDKDGPQCSLDQMLSSSRTAGVSSINGPHGVRV